LQDFAEATFPAKNNRFQLVPLPWQADGLTEPRAAEVFFSRKRPSLEPDFLHGLGL
jgi:hypothetical protein